MKNCHAACFIPFDRTKKRNKGSNSLIRPTWRYDWLLLPLFRFRLGISQSPLGRVILTRGTVIPAGFRYHHQNRRNLIRRR